MSVQRAARISQVTSDHPKNPPSTIPARNASESQRSGKIQLLDRTPHEGRVIGVLIISYQSPRKETGKIVPQL